MDTFWIKNPYVLVENYYEIIPTNKMNRINQMNTFTRLIIYFMILIILFGGGEEYILYSIIILIIIIVFYFIYINDHDGIELDLINNNTDKIDNFEQSDINCLNCVNNNNNILNKAMINIYDNKKDRVVKGTQKLKENIELESGYLDFNGNYKIGKDYSEINIDEYNKEKKNKKKVSFKEHEVIKANTCRKPTAENPFSNIIFSDYLDSSNIAEPCNVNDDNIKLQQNLYNSTIFRNTSDVFERENSQRLFYTLPITTVPNDQMDFAKWLYKTGPSCKENSQNCTYYEDPSMVTQRY